jgi:hypothetical protein
MINGARKKQDGVAFFGKYLKSVFKFCLIIEGKFNSK